MGVYPSADDFSISRTISWAASPAPTTSTSFPRAMIPRGDGRSVIERTSRRAPATSISESKRSVAAIERGRRTWSTGLIR